jgi:hypothetical protein
MKKGFLVLAGIILMQFAAFSQCDGVQLKPGADSYKKYTNGCQVIFDFCGKEVTLNKHKNLLNEVYPQAQFEFTAAGNDLFTCTLTIPDMQEKEYAVKVMRAMGFENVKKGDKKLNGNEAAIWFK